MTDNKKLILLAGGAIALGVIMYNARGSSDDDIMSYAGGGGGGVPFVRSEEPTQTDGSQQPVTYSVAFPDVSIPSLPTPPTGGGGGDGYSPAQSSTKKSDRIIESVTMSTGEKQQVAITAPPAKGIAPVMPGETWHGDDKGYTPTYASGIAGGTSTKKGAAVGKDTAPEGITGLVGNLLGGIGGLFGW